MPKAFKDYRVRLAQMGYDTSTMRGMGAAESNVDRFSNRLKKRGESWSLQGLKSMVHSLVKFFEEKLEHYARYTSRIHNILNDEAIAKGVREVACEVVGEVTKVKQSNLPIKYAGTTRSGGMSRFFRLLNDSILLVTGKC